ncbi:MAG: hypothetical protein K2L88_01010, partial [Clostridiales bacterium]|nr:hypothetical protein [Clostridiales bacterium]
MVMYLVKPSVTADKNHVKSVSVSAAQLFSELDANGNEVLYASIGNEYTVYSTVTVDDNSSTNVEWIYDKSDIKYVGSGTDENGAYFKFIPNIGKHGKKTTITACAATRLQSSQKIELTIVNQGAEDIRVTQYGVVGNMTQVKDDKYDKVLAITVPYYASAQSERESENNKEIRFNFNQFGKYDAAAKEYSKLTCVEIKNDKNETINTGDVSVTLKDSKDSQYIEILDVTQTEFKIKAKGICDHDIEIWLQANVNNATDCQILKKVIKVKIESNVSKKYVDTMLVFNKPVVDATFIKKVLTDGSTTQLASSKIRSELGKAENAELKVCSGNQRFVPTSGGFELVLPYNRSVTYNDIYRHVMVNPANIQYAGEKIIDNWYQFIEVSSSDTNVLTVNGTAKGTGAVKLGPIGLSGSIGGSLKCKLTLTDKRPGSAGAKVEIPVRIVAQTTGVSLKVVDDKITYQGEELASIKAGTGKSYAVSATYNFVAPENITLETLLENGTLSNVYSL